MKFCPNCDIRLVKASDSTVLSCTKCNYSEGDKPKPKKQSTTEESQTDFMVLDENEGKDVLPTMQLECSAGNFSANAGGKCNSFSHDRITVQELLPRGAFQQF